MLSPFARWLESVSANLIGPRRNQPRPATRPARSARLGVESLEDRAGPATHTWTDLGATNNWSEAANWSGGVPTNNESGGAIVAFPRSDTTMFQNIGGLVVD